MLVTITNVSTSQQAISCAYKTLEVGESITISRVFSEIDREIQLKQLVVDGHVTMGFVLDPTDSISPGFPPAAQSYTNATRPSAVGMPLGMMIWNAEDNAPNFADGLGNWVDPDGQIT